MTSLLRQLFRAPIKLPLSTGTTRCLSNTRTLTKNYEGDGKTTVSMLNRENKHLIIFDSISDQGFRFSNGIFAVGPIAAFPRTILQWNIPTVDDITPEALSLFMLLEPKLDIFILGVGSKNQKVHPDVIKFIKSHGINTEILHTEQACATFNFLNVEGRYVAGAFIPPTVVPLYEEDLILINAEGQEKHGPYLM